MQGTMKRVANMEDPSPEAKVKVSGCKSLHKPEKNSWKDAGIGTWIRTWCRSLYKCNQLKPKSACASSSGYNPTCTQFTHTIVIQVLCLQSISCYVQYLPASMASSCKSFIVLSLGIIMIVSYLYWGISCMCFHMMNTNHSFCMAHLCFSDCFRVTSRIWLCMLLCPCHINLVLRLWLYDLQ